jgi:hypothetical protein
MGLELRPGHQARATVVRKDGTVARRGRKGPGRRDGRTS